MPGDREVLVTDQIAEKTSAAGVTVDGVLNKDSILTADKIIAEGPPVSGWVAEFGQTTKTRVDSAGNVSVQNIVMGLGKAISGGGLTLDFGSTGVVTADEVACFGVQQQAALPVAHGDLSDASTTMDVDLGVLDDTYPAQIIDAFVFLKVSFSGGGAATLKANLGISGADDIYLDGDTSPAFDFVASSAGWHGVINTNKGSLLSVSKPILPANTALLAAFTCDVDVADLTAGQLWFLVHWIRLPNL